jgi:hypothetical protein
VATAAVYTLNNEALILVAVNHSVNTCILQGFQILATPFNQGFQVAISVVQWHNGKRAEMNRRHERLRVEKIVWNLLDLFLRSSSDIAL